MTRGCLRNVSQEHTHSDRGGGRARCEHVPNNDFVDVFGVNIGLFYHSLKYWLKHGFQRGVPLGAPLGLGHGSARHADYHNIVGIFWAHSASVVVRIFVELTI